MAPILKDILDQYRRQVLSGAVAVLKMQALMEPEEKEAIRAAIDKASEAAEMLDSIISNA